MILLKHFCYLNSPSKWTHQRKYSINLFSTSQTLVMQLRSNSLSSTTSVEISRVLSDRKYCVTSEADNFLVTPRDHSFLADKTDSHSSSRLDADTRRKQHSTTLYLETRMGWLISTAHIDVPIWLLCSVVAYFTAEERHILRLEYQRGWVNAISLPCRMWAIVEYVA